jgi:mono/diheme cytochrome c family protein
MPQFLRIFFFAGLALFFLTGCGDNSDGLSDFEREHGVGPITERIELGDLDMDKARQGEQIFSTQCVACHQLDAVITGPRLRNTFNTRSPEFIMNYILNPEGMKEKHPVAQELAEEYRGNMVNMGTTGEQARQLVEYLRAASKGEI